MSAFWEMSTPPVASVVQRATPIGVRSRTRRRLKVLAAENCLRVLGPPRSWDRPPQLAGLAYHGVVRTREEALEFYDPNLLTSSAFLERQMELVSRWLVPTPSTEAAQAPACAAVVGFDDAYTNVLENAVPTLEHWRIPAATFVNDATTSGECLWHDVIGSACPSPIVARRRVRELKDANREQVEAAVAECGGRDSGPLDRYMSWEQLEKWLAAGFEVGGHSSTHYILPLLDDETLSAELRDNRTAIARALGIVPTTFAYPNGNHDARVRQAVADAGFAVAFEIESDGGDGGPYSLPRRNICDAMCTDEDGLFSPALFLAEITGILRRTNWSQT